MKTVKYCDDLFQAELIKGRLENEGIRAEVINQHVNIVLPYAAAIPSLNVQVVVADEDYKRVTEILAEGMPTELVCPACGSHDIGYGLGKGKKRAGKLFAALLALFAFLPLGKIRSSYYCRECGASFNE